MDLSKPINEGHYSELQDRCHSLRTMSEKLLGEHHLILQKEELRLEYEAIRDALTVMHQRVGVLGYEAQK